MHTFIDNRNLPRKKGGHWHLSLCVLLQLKKNTPEILQLNVFQKILQLDLVLEGAFVPGTCNLYYRGGWCVPLQGLTWSSITRFDSRRYFCTLELATSTKEVEEVYSSVPAQLEQGFTWCSITRFSSGGCLSTLELAIFYYRGRGCVPLQGFTWSSMTGFGSRRCFCTLELANSTIEAKVCSSPCEMAFGIPRNS